VCLCLCSTKKLIVFFYRPRTNQSLVVFCHWSGYS
jgi:hypothetical protein